MIPMFKRNDVRTLGSGLAASLLAVLLFAAVAAMLTFAPRESAAKPAYAKATGNACTACHTAPPKLNACGKKWKADRTTNC